MPSVWLVDCLWSVHGAHVDVVACGRGYTRFPAARSNRQRRSSGYRVWIVESVALRDSVRVELDDTIGPWQPLALESAWGGCGTYCRMDDIGYRSIPDSAVQKASVRLSHVLLETEDSPGDRQ